MVGLDQDLRSVRVKITQYKVQVPGKEQQSEKVMVVVVLVLGLCVNWVKHTSPFLWYLISTTASEDWFSKLTPACLQRRPSTALVHSLPLY